MALRLWRTGTLNLSDLLYYQTDRKRYVKVILFELLWCLPAAAIARLPAVGDIVVMVLGFFTFLASWLLVSDNQLSIID